jgi:hypothetical protein
MYKIKKEFIQELKDAGVKVVQYSYFLAPLLKAHKYTDKLQES